MKHASKLLAILLASTLLLGLAACDFGGKAEETTVPKIEQTTGGEGGETLTLIVVRNAAEGKDGMEEFLVPYSGPDGPSVQDMADGLTELTGLNFGQLDMGAMGRSTMTIDWPTDSTLFGGSVNEKEEFFFFDYDSMAWFMLDSLYQTIRKNIPAMGQGVGEYDIYYTMNGGESLVLENLSPPMDFSLETPYMGSAFYFAHQGGR